jgi:hypothetical protein
MPHELLTTRDATRLGITRHDLNGPGWRQVIRGVWTPTSTPVTRALLVEAARLVLPADAVLCGLSVVSAHDIDVRASDDFDVHVAIAGQIPRRRPYLDLHQLALSPDEVTTSGSWPMTTPLRTAFDCARWLPLMEGVVVVDAMAHAGLIALADLEPFALAHPRVRGLWRAVQVARLADPLAESPMETRLRLVLVFNGLPRPVSQLEVRDRGGRFVARLDLAYEAACVAVEYDGSLHWEQRRADDRRRDALRALGWTVLVFSGEDVYRRPITVARQVEAALSRVSSR